MVHLTDFGLAKDLTGQAGGLSRSNITRDGVTLGTPHYMSPEQARGEFAALTPASDVWSLGCVLYELLAGHRAFRGEHSAAVIGQVIGAPAPRVRVPGQPTSLDRLLRATLSKTPAYRPTDAAALRDDLARVHRGESPLARPPRRVGPVWVLTAVVLLAVVAVGWWWGTGSPPPGVAPTSSPTVDPALAQAERAWRERSADAAAALHAVRAALAGRVPSPTWRARLGELCWFAGDLEGAEREWTAVPVSAPEYPAIQLDLGLLYLARAVPRYDAQLRDRASACFARAATAGTDAAAVATAIEAAMARESGAMERVAELPGWRGDLIRAIANYMGGDHAAAERAADACLAGGTRLPVLWLIRGFCRIDRADWDGARADLDTVLRDWPDNVDARLSRSKVHLRLGDRTAALADVDWVLARRPGHPPARNARGMIHATGGDLASAMEDFEAVLAAVPDDCYALYNRGRVHLLRGELPAALADLEAAFAAGAAGLPDAADLRKTLGTVYARLQRYADAAREFDQALAADPDDPDTRVNRAICRWRLGDRAGAREDVDAALRAAPGHPQATALRARWGGSPR